jgi:sigma-B regulation protein RsbU (phosphoserine phosphatase)
MKLRPDTLSLPAVLALGAAVLVGGVLAARAWLPGWRGGPLPAESVMVERYGELAARSGFILLSNEPRVHLVNGNDGFASDDDLIGSLSPESLEAMGWGVRTSVSRPALRASDTVVRNLAFEIAPDGRPRNLKWFPAGPTRLFANLNRPQMPQSQVETIAPTLLGPGESLGRVQPSTISGNPGYLLEIRGSSPPEHLLAMTQAGGTLYLGRHPGTFAEALERADQSSLGALFLRGTPWMLRFLAVFGLFFVLLSKRRIDVVNGALLGGLTLVASFVPVLAGGGPTTGEIFGALLGAGAQAIWVFLIWSAGESFLRAADPSFTTSLDALRAGRLGPRGGRSLLYGLAAGAALAGVELALAAAAVRLPLVWPERPLPDVPIFRASTSPFDEGIALAGGIVVVLAVLRRLVPARWTPLAVALAAAVLFGPLGFHPTVLQGAVNLLVIGALVFLGPRLGLTSLLTAAMSSFLFPAAIFSALHPRWLPGSLAVTAGSCAAILVLGLIGLRRPEQVELERLQPPPFIRRIEEERRLQYEMGLLARMQLGLLPPVPDIGGWEIAARSLVATEAGGDLYDFIEDDAGQLWIAAGDVAGHGYSCTIVHAMTAAALSSLIAPDKTPAEVLRQVDRVLRRGGHRNFASLALLRLDPATGEGLFGNAGHPYPMALSGGEVFELELPGLPLGQGPARTYLDAEVSIPEGGVLVLCSDGLFEAVDWNASPYGFDRPQQILRTLEHRSASEILDTLLQDWQRHLRSEQPPDDTTVIVIRRITRSAALS